MRIFLWILGIFATAVGLAVLVRFNAGNVVFFWPPYRVDISLNFFLLLLVLLYILLFLVFKAIHLALKLPSRISEAREQRKEQESNQALRESLKALFEGRFVQAQKAAGKAWDWEKNRGYAALIGARASQAVQQYDRRDDYLKSIEDDKDYDTACLVTKAELYIDEHQPHKALDVINELNANGTRHIHIQRMSLRANQQIGNWQEVLRLVQSLDKHHAIRPVLSEKLKEAAYVNLFNSAAPDAESVALVWQDIPEEVREKPAVAISAAKAFHHCMLPKKSEEILCHALDKFWDDRLVNAFVEFAESRDVADLAAQRGHCERWLGKYGRQPQLLLALGVLASRQKQFDKSASCFEEAVSLATDRHLLYQAHLLLAQLHDRLGNEEKAVQHYREASISRQILKA